jgi:hypothetical protein
MRYSFQVAACFALGAIALNSLFPVAARERITLAEWEQQYRYQMSHETGGIFSQEGILIKNMQGSAKEIVASEGDRRLSKNKILRHNHPAEFDASFSVGDWGYAAQVEARETGVVTQWSRYRLSCPWNASWWQQRGKPTLLRIQDELKPQYLDWAIALQQQGYTHQQAQNLMASEYWHAVNTQAASELGCSYSKEKF